METKFNFNSQVCTDKNQSERLLTLGLKKETADCRWTGVVKDSRGKDIPKNEQMWFLQLSESENYQTCGFSRTEFLPAWSLGRLWELYWSNKVVSDCLFGCGKYMNPYARMIAMIEYDIEDGTFNKDYLDK